MYWNHINFRTGINYLFVREAGVIIFSVGTYNEESPHQREGGVSFTIVIVEWTVLVGGALIAMVVLGFGYVNYKAHDDGEGCEQPEGVGLVF